MQPTEQWKDRSFSDQFNISEENQTKLDKVFKKLPQYGLNCGQNEYDVELKEEAESRSALQYFNRMQIWLIIICEIMFLKQFLF